MKALALAALFVSFACLASAGNVTELAKTVVATGRTSALAALDATEDAVRDTAHNIVDDIATSNEVIHSAVEVCRKTVDDGIACCCAAANRVIEFADDGVLRCRVAVAECTHAACTAIDGVLDGPAASAARQVVQGVGLVADKGFNLAVAGHEAAMGLGVRGLDLTQRGAHLALKGVDIAADVGHLAAVLSVLAGAAGAKVSCYVGRKLVNTVADDHINLINAIDNAMGGRPQQPAEGSHLHQE